MVGLDELAGQLSLGDKEIAKENEASPDAESEKVDVWSREEMPLVDACVQLIKVKLMYMLRVVCYYDLR